MFNDTHYKTLKKDCIFISPWYSFGDIHGENVFPLTIKILAKTLLLY